MAISLAVIAGSVLVGASRMMSSDHTVTSATTGPHPYVIARSVACDPSYPHICIPPPPPDLDCTEILFANFLVVGDDPHGFDADRDGAGCEH